MPTNRDISPLSLDELRSATYSADATDERQQPSASQKTTCKHCTGADTVSAVGMSSNQNDSILATNKKLSDENRDLRRCLSLLMENSQLQTMNVLSAVMAVCDDKLRNFTTECLISNDSPQKTTTRTTTETFRQSNNERASPSYGKSFANVGLSDLADNTFQTSPRRDRKARSPVNSHSNTSSTPPPHPPMKFGFGQSPYQQAEPKLAFDQSYSTKSHQKEGRQTHCKLRSKTRSPCKGKCCANNNTEKTQVKSSTAMCGQKSSSPIRLMSAPALPRKLIAQHAEYQDSKPYSDCDSLVSQDVKSVGHCRCCGVNMSPKCNCQSPRTLTRIDESTDSSMAPVHLSGKQQLPGSKQSTPTMNYHAPAQQAVFHNIPANQNGSFRKPLNPTSDRRGTVFKKLVSKVINLRRIPEDRSQSNDDYVIEQFRRERKKYERILAASNDSDDQSTQTTNADTETIDGNLTTDDQLTCGSIDRTADLDSRAVTSVMHEYVSRNKTTPRNETDRQGEVYERLGTPQATSTPMPSPVKRFRESNLEPSSLATIMGITGKGSLGKAEYILHRPVDILIGYSPNISDRASYMLTASTPNRRIVGEIAFQLDRRILEYVFAGTNDSHTSKRRSRYYGYSVSSIMLLIDKEVRKADNNLEVERRLKTRLDIITGNLFRFGYDYERHSEFTQDMVNKYGLLNGPPDPCTVEGFGLSEPAVLRILLGQLVKNTQELDDMLILLDCLHYMAHKDKRPLFMW